MRGRRVTTRGRAEGSQRRPPRRQPAAGPRRGPQELVAEEGLVRALAGEHRLVAGVADASAEQVPRGAVRVVLDRLGVEHGVGEVIGQVAIRCGHDRVPCAGRRGRLARAPALVVVAALEADREGGDRVVYTRRGHAEHRRRVQPAAQQASHGHGRDHAQRDRLFREFAHAPDGFVHWGAGRPRAAERGGSGSVDRDGEVPVAFQTHPGSVGVQHVARRHLRDAREERDPLVGAGVKRVVDAPRVPRSRDAGGHERLGLGREVEAAFLLGIKEGLQPEPIACREEDAALFIPNSHCKLSPQVLKARGAEVLVQVERDFAVRARAEAVALRFEPLADALVVVELAVDDDVEAPVLAGDRLVTFGVGDREEVVAQARASRGGDPDPLAVGAAVAERGGGVAEGLLGHGVAGIRRQDYGDSTHRRLSRGGARQLARWRS